MQTDQQAEQNADQQSSQPTNQTADPKQQGIAQPATEEIKHHGDKLQRQVDQASKQTQSEGELRRSRPKPEQ